MKEGHNEGKEHRQVTATDEKTWIWSWTGWGGNTKEGTEGERPNKRSKCMSASTYFHGMPYQWDRYAASERGMCSGEKRGDRAVEIV